MGVGKFDVSDVTSAASAQQRIDSKHSAPSELCVGDPERAIIRMINRRPKVLRRSRRRLWSFTPVRRADAARCWEGES